MKLDEAVERAVGESIKKEFGGNREREKFKRLSEKMQEDIYTVK